MREYSVDDRTYPAEDRSVRLLFVGPPGAGKGTQAQRVAERLGIPHVSTGEMFRHHVANGSDLGMKVEAIMAAGDYVPDEITVAMLEQRIGEPEAAGGYILDGFPRTVAQVRSLDDLIGEDGLDKVVVFEVDETELVERMLSRGRADDSSETIRKRFEVYMAETRPLLDIYDDRGITVSVDGLGEMDEVTDRIVDVLESRHQPGTPV
ncbi:MAG: adenylate kinase [Acidobacteria bacterium]|nr:MAG: adenylate kinase [Acidobacteriota bacterium]